MPSVAWRETSHFERFRAAGDPFHLARATRLLHATARRGAASAGSLCSRLPGVCSRCISAPVAPKNGSTPFRPATPCGRSPNDTCPISPSCHSCNELNRISDPHRMQPGTRLRIPVAWMKSTRRHGAVRRGTRRRANRAGLERRAAQSGCRCHPARRRHRAHAGGRPCSSGVLRRIGTEPALGQYPAAGRVARLCRRLERGTRGVGAGTCGDPGSSAAEPSLPFRDPDARGHHLGARHGLPRERAGR